jgi:CBS domain-containing protein
MNVEKHLVKEVMRTDAPAVGPNTTVAMAAELMFSRGFPIVVIVEGKKPVGILTSTDFRRLERFRSAPVRRVMVSPFLVVKPETDIAEAARIMAKNRIGSLVVTAHGELVGVVTRREIMKFSPMVGPEGEEVDELKKQIEQQEAELKGYRQMEKEYLGLQQKYEKLYQEKAELEAMCAREDLKKAKEELYSIDGRLKLLEGELKDGGINQKQYERAKGLLLKYKIEVSHKSLILEDILKKTIAKTELEEVAREKHVPEFKLKEVEEKKEKERPKRKAVSA